jgi:hypothetical protein
MSCTLLFRFKKKPRKLLSEGYLYRRNSLGFNSCNGGGLMLGEEFANGLGELGSLSGPVIDAVALEVDACGIGAGIVGTDHFDGTAIAGAVLFDDNDAVMGLLTGANARQTNHQHRVDPLRKSLDGFRVAVTCTGKYPDGMIGTTDGRKSPNT